MYGHMRERAKMVGSAGFEPAVTSDLASYCPEARMLTKLHHNPERIATHVFHSAKRIVGSITRWSLDTMSYHLSAERRLAAVSYLDRQVC